MCISYTVPLPSLLLWLKRLSQLDIIYLEKHINFSRISEGHYLTIVFELRLVYTAGTAAFDKIFLKIMLCNQYSVTLDAHMVEIS